MTTAGFRSPAWLLGGPVGVAMLALVVVPCMAILMLSFAPNPIAASNHAFPTLSNYAAILGSRTVEQALIRTLEVSAWTTALSVLAGYPLAFHIARQKGVLASAYLAVVIFPFMLSAVVRAYGWGVILGERGLLNSLLLSVGLVSAPVALLHTDLAIVIGETHLLLPYMVLALLSAMRAIDPNLSAAAMSLGATPAAVFWRVLVPATWPGLVTGTLLVFTLALTAFATPYLLGGTRAPVLATLIYRYGFVTLDWQRGAAVAVVLLLLCTTFFFLHRWVGRSTLGRLGAES